MGLDMYLNGEKYISGDYENPANDPTEDGYPLKTKGLRLGYWRKHPDLHGYIVEVFAEGKDECQEIELTAEDIEKIIKAVEANTLPHTEGFFFGVTNGSEQQTTLNIFRKALAWLRTEEPNISRSVNYRASW